MACRNPIILRSYNAIVTITWNFKFAIFIPGNADGGHGEDDSSTESMTLQIQLDASERLNEKWQGDLQMKEHTISKMQDELSFARSEKGILERKYASACAKLEESSRNEQFAAERSQRSMEKQVRQLEMKFEGLSRKNNMLWKENEALRMQQGRGEGTLTGFEQLKQQQEQQLANSQNESRDITQLCISQRTEIDELNKVIDECQDIMERQADENETLKTGIERCERDTILLIECKKQYEEEINGLKSQNKTDREHITKLRDENQKHLKILNRTKAELVEKTKQNGRLKAELNSTKNCKQELENANRRLAEMHKKVENDEIRILESRKRYELMNKELKFMRGSLANNRTGYTSGNKMRENFIGDTETECLSFDTSKEAAVKENEQLNNTLSAKGYTGLNQYGLQQRQDDYDNFEASLATMFGYAENASDRQQKLACGHSKNVSQGCINTAKFGSEARDILKNNKKKYEESIQMQTKQGNFNINEDMMAKVEELEQLCTECKHQNDSLKKKLETFDANPSSQNAAFEVSPRSQRAGSCEADAPSQSCNNCFQDLQSHILGWKERQETTFQSFQEQQENLQKLFIDLKSWGVRVFDEMKTLRCELETKKVRPNDLSYSAITVFTYHCQHFNDVHKDY